VDGAVKTLKKRVDTAQARVAFWLNNDVFHRNGPKEELCKYLGWVPGDPGLLTEHVRGKTKECVPLFPVKESDGIGAVEKCNDPALQLSIGWLRQFDSRQNSSQDGGLPFCSFQNTPYIRGANLLPLYGPMYFHMLKLVVPACGDVMVKLWEKDVDAALGHEFKW